jgi:hypothetical protein
MGSRTRGVATGVVALSICLAGCAREAPRARAVTRDSAGIAVVDNPGTDVPLSWTFRTDFTLGGRESGPEAWTYLGPSTVGADGLGRLYVLDMDARHVLVYDENGTPVQTMGGQGGGPGELQMTAGMAVGPDGTVWVLDFGKGAYVRYGPDGSVLPERRPPIVPLPNRQRSFAVGAEDLVVSTMAPRTDGQQGYWNALRVFSGPDSTDLRTLETLPAHEVRMLDCGGIIRLPPLFGPEMIWDRRGERLAVTSTAEYVVDLYDGAALVRSVRRELPVRDATKDMALKEVGEGMRVRFGDHPPCVFPGEKLVEEQGFAPRIPWVASVALAPDGAIWVARRAVGEGVLGPIDIFDAGGVYEGTLPDDTPFPVAFLSDGRIAVVRTDSMDVPRILVQRVVVP